MKTYRLGAMRRLGNAVIKPLVRSGLITGNYALLTVRGRSTGRLYTTPVRLLERDGQSWLVAPYGAVSWVRNARAAGRSRSAEAAATGPPRWSNATPSRAGRSCVTMSAPYQSRDPTSTLGLTTLSTVSSTRPPPIRSSGSSRKPVHRASGAGSHGLGASGVLGRRQISSPTRRCPRPRRCAGPPTPFERDQLVKLHRASTTLFRGAGHGRTGASPFPDRCSAPRNARCGGAGGTLAARSGPLPEFGAW